MHIHLFSIIHPSPFWNQRSTAEIQGLRLWKSLSRATHGRTQRPDLSPQEVEAGKLAIETAQGCSSPLSGRSPKKGAEGTSTSLIFLEQLNSPTSSTNRIHPCKAGLPLIPFRAAARLSIWSYDATDTNCKGLVSF